MCLQHFIKINHPAGIYDRVNGRCEDTVLRSFIRNKKKKNLLGTTEFISSELFIAAEEKRRETDK